MSEPSTRSRLEERYRSVLRMLPASYREVWEEDMIATFLAGMATDDAEDAEFVADYGRPSWSEVVSVAALAVRLRLGADERRGALWGAALRRVALVSLLVHAASAVIGLGFLFWLAGRLPFVAPPQPDVAEHTLHDRWYTIPGLTMIAWVPAYLAVLWGQPRTGRILALLGLAGYAVPTVAELFRAGPLLVTTWFNLMLSGVFVAALAAFRPGVPPVRRRPWLLALPVAVPLLLGAGLVTWPRDDQLRLPVLDWPGICVAALALAAVVHLARRARPPSWSLALALFAAAVGALRVLSLADYLMSGSPDVRNPMLALGAVEALVVLAVAVPLWSLAASALRGAERAHAPASAATGSR
jgi:hypothetical protein